MEQNNHITACIHLLNEQNVVITNAMNQLMAAQAVIAKVSGHISTLIVMQPVADNSNPGVYGTNGKIGEVVPNRGIVIGEQLSDKPVPLPPALSANGSKRDLEHPLSTPENTQATRGLTFPNLNLPGIIEHQMPPVKEQHNTPALTHDAEFIEPIKMMQNGVVSDSLMKVTHTHLDEAPLSEQHADAFMVKTLLEKLTGTNCILHKYLSGMLLQGARGWLGLEEPSFVSNTGRTNATPAELGRLDIRSDEYRHSKEGVYITRDHTSGYSVCELKLDVDHSDIKHVVHFDWNNKENHVNITVTVEASNDIYGANSPYTIIPGAPGFAVMIPAHANVFDLAAFIKSVETKLASYVK